ncbi:SDR family oxidoreductase [Phaeovulum vinaykumarii]|uniref:3-oxoacyl-[acyl-carrier protein] reductase n=1 Tax=Phaeovulum vinaykumarii TaxID=407234 RepID=A0A1N7JQT9_9RHOB|nr:SDR family oxidoreductase [Phaeovulum vinaykumarii]SIS51604.1 3-oxoacyl-[acyl-carrier protein] reductase [Phaeovulum vinaykumarii]SOB90832.1 3-oxoacyl-[acyl-carrier protein] reductase [Phaeovulum vinaykumarii]
MDLGIAGRRALVCAGSKGLGRGAALALAEAGVGIVLNARGAEALERTASEIRDRFGVPVTPIAADITTDTGRAEVLAQAGDIDILVTNAGGPPPGHWADWARADLQAAIEANMLTPIFLMQAVLPGMLERRWGRVVNITSQSVRAPIPELGLSNTARAGLTGFVAGVARQVAAQGVTINNVLPGLHATDRATALDTRVAAAEGITMAEVARRRMETIPARSYGDPRDFGAICAFLCGEPARFIVGQNILVDGGTTNITL